MRYATVFTLVFYFGLTTYAIVRALLGLEFQHWLAFLLPLAGFVFALLHGAVRLGRRGVLLFLGSTIGVSLALESLGVATGLIYGPYHYTERLGPLFLGLVPYLIPLTWFMMLYPADVIAHRLIARRQNAARVDWRGIVGAATLGGLVMTSWDLVVDPLMVSRRHWIWEEQGAYFGIPLQNFLGWWLTSFLALVLIAVLGGYRGALTSKDDFNRQAVLSYAITGVANILDATLTGLVRPALVAAFAMGAWVWLGWGRVTRQ